MGKSRQIFEKIDTIRSSRNGRIIVLTGARQVGKTTIVREWMKDYQYISIEDPVTRETYKSLTSDQWHSLYPAAALDEVQKVPEIIESIKAAYDKYQDVRYVLLGSSQLLLLNKVKESLAGRCTIFDIYPLTLPEIATRSWNDNAVRSVWQESLVNGFTGRGIYPSFLIDPRHVDKQSAWNYYMKFGGYPALLDETFSDDDRYLWLRNYVRTYLERDVRDLASFRDLAPFVKLQREVCSLSGQVLNASSISKDLNISSKTVQRYINYLELSYQEIVLPSWSRNESKRLAKAPKLHSMDFGVQQAVLGKHGGMTGHEFESAIVSELFKQAKNMLAEASFYHLRTADGAEVDLIVEVPNGYYAFEVKMTENVSKSDARHLKGLSSILDKKIIASIVLSNDPVTKDLGDGIIAVNAAMFLG